MLDEASLDLKNPNSKAPFEETKVSVFVKFSPGLRVSFASDSHKIKQQKVAKQMGTVKFDEKPKIEALVVISPLISLRVNVSQEYHIV